METGEKGRDGLGGGREATKWLCREEHGTSGCMAGWVGGSHSLQSDWEWGCPPSRGGAGVSPPPRALHRGIAQLESNKSARFSLPLMVQIDGACDTDEPLSNYQKE